MLNLNPNDLGGICVSAVLSASMARQAGETDRAARLESLAHAIARDLLCQGERGKQVLETLQRHDSPDVRALCHSHRANVHEL